MLYQNQTVGSHQIIASIFSDETIIIKPII
jgi:hypothetical protein